MHRGFWFTARHALGRIDAAGVVTAVPLPITPSAVTPARCGPPELSRTAGPTTATVSFVRSYRQDGVDQFSDIGVRLARAGQPLFSESVPSVDHQPATSDSTALTVRGLDGDGEPEAALRLDGGGGKCCWWSRVNDAVDPRSTRAYVKWVKVFPRKNGY